MNSGFSNVTRKKDFIKMKSFVSAILIQMLVLPALLTIFYFNDSTNYLVANVGLPPLFLVGNAVGGFLFGIFMHYTAGCGAGIFYKIGEKNSGAILAVIGFIVGVYITEKGILNIFKESSQSLVLFDQQPVWAMDSPVLVTSIVAVTAGISLFLLYRKGDSKPGGALWGWKKTGIAVGTLGIIGWTAALFFQTSYGMAIIPGVVDAVDLYYTWSLMFVVGIPMGAYWSSRHDKEKRFTLPKMRIIGKRLVGGLGLGVSGSIAAGCTVGHGLTFVPLLGVGSLVAILFIFLGSGLMGYLTRT